MKNTRFAFASSLLALVSAGTWAHAQTVTFGGSAGGNAGAKEKSAPKPSSSGNDGAGKAEEGDDWSARDRGVNESANLYGGTGLIHTQHAQTGQPGQFRLGFVTEWFSAGFLCTNEYRCRNPRGAGQVVSSRTNHIGANLSLGVSLAKLGPGVLDVYGFTSGYGNSDPANRPSLLQVLGDSALGFKYGAPLSKVFHLGGFIELWLLNGAGSVGLDGGSTSAKFGLPVTFDLRGLESKTPLRFSTNFAYRLDNSANVLSPTEAPVSQGGRGEPVTRVERFGLNVNRVDLFDMRIGGEFFAAEERVRPFLEYGISIPNNRQNYACNPNNPHGDKCLATDAVAPSRLTLGGRFFPWKRGFSAVAAFDIGLGGTSAFIEELSPTPPWMLYVGAGWAVDTVDRPGPMRMKTVEKVVERGTPHGSAMGFVHEKDKQEGIAKAVVAFESHPDMTSLITSQDGKFVARELAEGTYRFGVTAEGYKGATCEATLAASADPKAGKTVKDVSVDCALEALPRVGTIVGHVKDEGGGAMAGVQVKMVDAARKEYSVVTDAGGAFRFENVPPGTAEVSVAHDGFLSYVAQTDVKARQDNGAEVTLRPKPKNANVEVRGKEITIKQQIQFALDSAVILQDSFGILTEVADVLIRNPRLRRLEIQGHTDNQGAPDHNKRLSEQRAESVRTWLVQHGVSGDRLTSKGFGQDRPLVPNVTGANRARNRRVQFMIQEQDAASPAPPKKDGKLPPGF